MAKREKRSAGLLLLLGLTIGFAAWGAAQVEKPLSQSQPGVHLKFKEVRTWGYQLQNVKASRIPEETDLLVVDYSADGSDGEAFTRAQVDKLRRRDGRKPRIVLAYLSIGEAENYRYYWWQFWRFVGPGWLGKENKEWQGNFPVRYWYRGWQSIIVKPKRTLLDNAIEKMMPWRKPYLDRIIDAGFDGIYLDRVDVFGEWAEERREAAQDMVRFVATLSAYAKERQPGFLIVPQNGEELLRFKNYRSVIDGIAKEDLYYGIDGDGQDNPRFEIDKSVRLLEKARADGLPVMVVEYLDDREQQIDAQRLTRKAGFLINFAKRDLEQPPVPVRPLPIAVPVSPDPTPSPNESIAAESIEAPDKVPLSPAELDNTTSPTVSPEDKQSNRPAIVPPVKRVQPKN